MIFDAVVCVTKHLQFVLHLAKSLPYIPTKISHSVHCNNKKMSCHLPRDAKATNISFASKPYFLPKFLQNSDFRPCIICFNTHEENLKPEYKRF